MPIENFSLLLCLFPIPFLFFPLSLFLSLTHTNIHAHSYIFKHHLILNNFPYLSYTRRNSLSIVVIFLFLLNHTEAGTVSVNSSTDRKSLMTKKFVLEALFAFSTEIKTLFLLITQ
jgi:hypothetical protein